MPQRGEGLRVRGGHIQSRLPREPPVVDEVALRLRLPAEQALCGMASPGTRACLPAWRNPCDHGQCPSPKNIKNPRNITFYALKPESTTAETSRPHAYLSAAGRVTPCAPLLASKRTSFPQPPPFQCFTLKKHIMQVPVFTTCYVRSQSAQDAGRVATGFPLPSTGRGIEGEGWSYPEPPPARASRGGRSRAATPFACGAGTLWRGFAEGLRMTLWPSKQPSFPKASLN